jgi:hypothetical protein
MCLEALKMLLIKIFINGKTFFFHLFPAPTALRKPTAPPPTNNVPAKFIKVLPPPKKPTPTIIHAKIPNQVITNHKINPATAHNKRPLVRNNSTLKRENIIPSNVENRLTARSKTMIEIRDNRSVKTKLRGPHMDMSRSLKKSSKEDVHRMSKDKISDNGRREKVDGGNARRSEPKTLPSEDGWLTVKNKRRSSSSLHWATRFNQPSGYASLPTLSLDEDGEEQSKSAEKPKPEETHAIKPVVEPSKPSSNRKDSNSNVKKPADSGKDPPGVTSSKRKVNSSTCSSTSSSSSREKKEDIQQLARQKSDLTGLKLKTLHKEFLRNEKLNAQIVSNAEKQQNNDQELISELSKVDMNVQTTNIMSQAINDLYEVCLNKDSLAEDVVVNGDAGEESVISYSIFDELDEKEDEKEERKLLDEQESLERQIRELESAEIDIDTETDETDCEAIIDLEDTESNIDQIDNNGNELDENMTLEMRYEAVLSGGVTIENQIFS